MTTHVDGRDCDAGDGDPARWAALAKLVAGDAAMKVTTDAVQLLGALR